ncbi:DUF1573 domain-containing protein [soil metagenome]
MIRTTKPLLAALFLAAISTAQAQLTWDKTEAKLNPKPGDKEAVAHFTYENKGSTPVRIVAVKSSCGCTVPELKKREVAPGEKGELTATFTIGNRTGLQQKVVSVQTDHPEQPMTNLLLTANIGQSLAVQPSFVYWEAGEAPKPKQITVKPGPGVAVSKLQVTSSNPEFTTKVERAASGDFVIQVQPKDTAKQSATTLTIQPDFPQTFVASARVTGPAGAATR